MRPTTVNTRDRISHIPKQMQFNNAQNADFQVGAHSDKTLLGKKIIIFKLTVENPFIVWQLSDALLSV
jgi:hypothetical protein